MLDDNTRELLDGLVVDGIVQWYAEEEEDDNDPVRELAFFLARKHARFWEDFNFTNRMVLVDGYMEMAKEILDKFCTGKE